MNLLAIQVVGEGSFALPPFFNLFEPIQWKCYGDSCSCVFQREIRVFGNKSEGCQQFCKRNTALWATVPNHLMGFEDFKKNLQGLLGNQLTVTEIKAFQDQNGELVKWGGRIKSVGVQGRDQEKLIRKLYRITFPKISRGSTADDRSPVQPGTNVLVGYNAQLPPPYSALGETRPTLDKLNASIQKAIHSTVKKQYWQLISNHVKNYAANNGADHLLRIVANLLEANPCPDELPFWEEIFAYIKDYVLPIVEQLAVLRLGAAKRIHWVQIIKLVKVNQVQFVVDLAASDPRSNELEHWVEIVKCIKDNQLSISEKLALSKLGVAELKNWVEVFKHVEDNQLPMVDQLAVLNPYARNLEMWRAVNSCGGTLT